MNIVHQTQLTEYPLLSRGKVRDIYEIDAETLLIVTTDRMSAFDVVMNEPIPYKGVVLNTLTLFWMEHFAGKVQNHLLASEISDFPAKLKAHAADLEGRSVVVRKAEPLPIECIVRGYITGSGWKDYLATGEVCGHVLPQGLQESERLEKPLFTPSTKAEIGEHDENITIAQALTRVDKDVFDIVQETSLSIYTEAREFAKERGIIIADTKFEFGMLGGKPVLIDEVLTPDSSRFWPMDGYEAGRSQPSFDKQYLRDWLSGTGWGKTPPPPTLPEDVVMTTKNKYLQAYRLITGIDLDVP